MYHKHWSALCVTALALLLLLASLVGCSDTQESMLIYERSGAPAGVAGIEEQVRIMTDGEALLTRDGRTARVAVGDYYILNEKLLVGVLTLPGRVVLVIGHGPPLEEAGTWSQLLPIYEDIIQSIQNENGAGP